MPTPTPKPASHQAELVYSPTARHFHWVTAALIFIMLPLGIYMTYRGNTLNIWDATTNRLYSLHKLLGIIILGLAIARLVYRIRNGAPKDEPTLEPWQKGAAHATHWGLYALLIMVPLGGWIGVSLYGARDIFGLFSLPALTAQDQAAAGRIFFFHMLGAFAIVGLVGAHVGAAIFHHVIRKDGVLRRMMPGLGQKG